MIIALMIGRKRSTGYPGKNTVPVLNRPLCAYPLLAANHSRFVDQIFVSTDDEKIMDIAKGYGAETIVRPPELATNEALGEDCYVHAYEYIKSNRLTSGKQIEMIVLLMCNAATILTETIDSGIELLRSNPHYDSAVSVSCYNMWSPLRARKIDGNGCLQPFVPFETFGNPKTLSCDRDSQGDSWYADMGVSIIRPKNLDEMENGMLPQKWMGQNIAPLKQWGGCDVDYEWQMPGVEFWLRKHGFTETKTPYDV